MCGLTALQRCAFAEQALAEHQAILADLRQREQAFVRWIAYQRSKNNEDVQSLLLRQLKKEVQQRVIALAKKERKLMSFLDLPEFRDLKLRRAPVCEQSAGYIVALPDLPAFKGEPLDTRFLNLKG